MLAIRAMAGETAWLDGQTVWHEGRVAWMGTRGPWTPDAGAIALAQRRLAQIADHPVAAARALGDATAWLERRRSRLELAKRLYTVHVPDLVEVARRARTGHHEDAQHLVELLAAEAVCVNGLPLSPCATLLRCGAPVAPALRAALRDEALPPTGRALAALALGALWRQDADGSGVTGVPAGPRLELLRRAYIWGTEAGGPDDPALIVTLLADPDGPALAHRYVQSARTLHHFALPGALLRELLATGTPAAQVVALVESMAAAEPLAARILAYRAELPTRSARLRWAAAAQLSRERHQIVADLAAVLHAYARATADPAVLHAAVRFAHAMLDLGTLTREMADAMVTDLRNGLTLTPGVQRAYVELLAAYHARLWPQEGFDGAVEHGHLQQWFERRWARDAKPVLTLLHAGADMGVVRDALELGIHGALSSFRWREPDRYRLVLDLVQQLDCPAACWDLGFALSGFSDLRSARRVLQPLLQALLAAPAPLRCTILDGVLGAVARDLLDLRALVPRLVPYVPHLIGFGRAHEGDESKFELLVQAALVLDHVAPDQAHAWLDWLLSYLSTLTGRDGFYLEGGLALRQGVLLAATLAHGDAARFWAVAAAALQHRFDYNWEIKESSIAALKRFPVLHAPLGALFPQQPTRCMALVIRAGLTTRLGTEALTTLEAGAPTLQTDQVALPAAWYEPLEEAPDLAPLVAAYVRARELQGLATDVPPGVRQALDQPRRWTLELAHLEGLIATRPERADLTTRAANLRARLANTATWRAAVRAETAERLAQLTAEAQLAVAEGLVLSCYRARLERVAGPLPPGLQLDEDLLNAILLAVDIRQNRRLLLRLLRAYVAGDRRWPERHPANVAFLERLAAAGVDSAAWLSAHRRVYACAGMAGGRIHLHLERDPLRVLQMGNLFDTCLSFGGINAFSTVANACELNKRVVYARDGKGRIVGRKLIGLGTDGALVGFRTYSASGDEESNAMLRRLIAHYCAGFAARCNLRLADDGAVPTLFAQDWYDDGVVPWHDEERTAHIASPARQTSPTRV